MTSRVKTWLTVISFLASACIATPALADPATETVWVQPNMLTDLAVIRPEDRTPIDSGQCAMALLRAVEINNYFHLGFKTAPTIEDRTVGAAASITQFDCYADPEGKPLFYLEMTLALHTAPLNSGIPLAITRYFTFNEDGELQGWLL